jgi:hypothetical protein
MSRFTINDLRKTVTRYNRYAMLSGSEYYYREQGRNGYQAVDLYRIREDGSESCERLLEAGSSRECASAIADHHNRSVAYPPKRRKLTRMQALKAVELAGLDIAEDYHTQNWDAADLMTEWAKRTGYRKPKNAKGSTGRYFWEHLQRLAKREGK